MRSSSCALPSVSCCGSYCLNMENLSPIMIRTQRWRGIWHHDISSWKLSTRTMSMYQGIISHNERSGCQLEGILRGKEKPIVCTVTQQQLPVHTDQNGASAKRSVNSNVLWMKQRLNFGATQNGTAVVDILGAYLINQREGRATYQYYDNNNDV